MKLFIALCLFSFSAFASEVYLSRGESERIGSTTVYCESSRQNPPQVSVCGSSISSNPNVRACNNVYVGTACRIDRGGYGICGLRDRGIAGTCECQ